MNKKRILAVSAIFFAVLLALTGCLSREEKKKLEQTETLAVDYLTSKYTGYSENLTVKDSGYEISNVDPFAIPTSNMWFKFYDGTTVFYQYENGKGTFYDDRQSKIINKKIMEEILSPIFDNMGDIRFGSPNQDMESVLKLSNRYENEIDKSFYHEYYNGNIEDFLNKEEVFVDTRGNIYLICDGDEWAARFEVFENQINRYFKGNYERMGVTLVSMTQDGYMNGATDYYDDGAFARLLMAKGTTELYIQKYIEVADGIYICACRNGFILQDGDIVFEPVQGFGEFADKTAYKPRFSDRIDDENFFCYVKLDERIYNDSESGLHAYIPYYKDSSGVCKAEPTRTYINEDYTYWYGVSESKFGNIYFD